MKSFDAIIIGSGQGGNPLAKWLSDKGRQVALIESSYIGGTCINAGCTPTKTLVGVAKRVAQARMAQQFGLLVNEGLPDYQLVKRRKDEVVSSFRRGLEEALIQDTNITVFRGQATFSGHKQVEVQLANAGHEELKAPLVFINTGAKARIPDIAGLEAVPYFTAQSLLERSDRPRHLVVIGGGYIALEFAQIYKRLGSQVTIIEVSARLLPKEDDDVGLMVGQILDEEGVAVITEAVIRRVYTNGAGVAIDLLAAGRSLTVSGSDLLVATGRRPNTENLHLDRTGIQVDSKGFIPVNEFLETSQAGIYALGDVKEGPAFTHVSYHDYLVVVDHLSGKTALSIRDRLIPYCLFTDPELGRVGMTEVQAKKEGLDFSVAKLETAAIARAVETGEMRGFIKAIIDNRTERILGVAALCAVGGELMSLFQIAMMGRLTYVQLRDNMFAHPTYAEAINNLFNARNIKPGRADEKS